MLQKGLERLGPQPERPTFTTKVGTTDTPYPSTDVERHEVKRVDILPSSFITDKVSQLILNLLVDIYLTSVTTVYHTR